MGTNTMTGEEAYAILAGDGSALDQEAICSAITRLGKPYDKQQVCRAAPLVQKFLHHDSHIVRYQAIWFLGSWGKQPEYLSCIIASAQSDADVDNRAFAARAAGTLLRLQRDARAIQALFDMATDEEEAEDVRMAAYGSLLYVYYGETARSQSQNFSPAGNKSVADFDRAWLAFLPQWIEGLPAKTN